MPSWDDFVNWALKQALTGTGRAALRRRWTGLRALAEQVSSQIGADEVRRLLGKELNELDPEHNDLKALAAYAAGKGLLPDLSVVQKALSDDARADPLFFLAAHSGKTFGEKYAPLFAEFWLVGDGDEWTKKKAADLYDVSWKPKELKGRDIRIELKASSEHPGYLFQQIRHPKMSGGKLLDCDMLLCIGVCASAIEWWAIPATAFDDLAENGVTDASKVAITLHHGKRRPIWNQECGFRDEGWFRTDPNVRKILLEYSCSESSRLREKLLGMVGE